MTGESPRLTRVAAPHRHPRAAGRTKTFRESCIILARQRGIWRQRVNKVSDRGVTLVKLADLEVSNFSGGG